MDCALMFFSVDSDRSAGASASRSPSSFSSSERMSSRRIIQPHETRADLHFARPQPYSPTSPRFSLTACDLETRRLDEIESHGTIKKVQGPYRRSTQTTCSSIYPQRDLCITLTLSKHYTRRSRSQNRWFELTVCKVPELS